MRRIGRGRKLKLRFRDVGAQILHAEVHHLMFLKGYLLLGSILTRGLVLEAHVSLDLLFLGH